MLSWVCGEAWLGAVDGGAVCEICSTEEVVWCDTELLSVHTSPDSKHKHTQIFLCLAAFLRSDRQADAQDGALMTTAQQGCVAKAPQWICVLGYGLYAFFADQYYQSVQENATSLRVEA